MKITIEEISGLKIADLKSKIIESPKKVLEEVSLFDLIFDGDEEQAHLHGVYLFFDPSGQVPLYIGKVQSPQFIERLPCHLAVGEGSWSNQFLKSHRDRTKANSLPSAAASVRDCQLLLILAPPDFAPRLEALCIQILNPAYNKRKPTAGLPRQLDSECTIGSLWESIQSR